MNAVVNDLCDMGKVFMIYQHFAPCVEDNQRGGKTATPIARTHEICMARRFARNRVPLLLRQYNSDGASAASDFPRDSELLPASARTTTTTIA